MRIYPAIHYTMGGLWVDYNLMSTVPGLHVLGEANFSDHGANRLGASALMQGLADGYFVIPYTLAHYLGGTSLPAVTIEHDAFERGRSIRAVRTSTGCSPSRGRRRRVSCTASSGQILWDDVGMARNEAGLRKALARIPELRDEFWQNVSVPGPQNNLNKNLEYAGRVADYLEFAELLALDALASHRVVRRALPRGKPDARRRGAARRRAFLVRGGVGIQRRRRAADAAQGTARVRVREADPAELQISASSSFQLPVSSCTERTSNVMGEAGLATLQNRDELDWKLELEAGCTCASI